MVMAILVTLGLRYHMMGEKKKLHTYMVWKHLKNDGPCNERGWSCIPLVVETYGGWGQEAVTMFARLSKLLSLRQRQSCSAALNELYCRLSVVLMRQNAQALLAHAAGAR